MDKFICRHNKANSPIYCINRNIGFGGKFQLDYEIKIAIISKSLHVPGKVFKVSVARSSIAPDKNVKITGVHLHRLLFHS